VYCNRPFLCVCVFVCLWVRLTTANWSLKSVRACHYWRWVGQQCVRCMWRCVWTVDRARPSLTSICWTQHARSNCTAFRCTLQRLFSSSVYSLLFRWLTSKDNYGNASRIRRNANSRLLLLLLLFFTLGIKDPEGFGKNWKKMCRSDHYSGQSSNTKESCSSTPLNRCTSTETRWNMLLLLLLLFITS